MKVLLSFLFAACCLPALASEVLVVQKVTREESGDILITRELAFALGNELQETFALRSVVWSLADPTFRKQLRRTRYRRPRISNTSVGPGGRKEIGRNLCRMDRKQQDRRGPQKYAESVQSRHCPPIYKRELSLVAQINQNNDPDFVGRSTARTWALELATGALKTYIKSNPVPDPDGDATVTAPIPTYTPEPPTFTVVDEPSLSRR